MAQQLWLLRHGEAVPHGTRPDPERELTPKGEAQSRAAGRALARAGVTFAGVYASPKVRARDTARLACEPLGGEVVEHGALGEGFDGRDARELLLGHDGGARVLVVGHEPDFSQTVYDLTGARVDFKKGGVAAVRLNGSPRLILLLRPAELRLLGGDAAGEPG